MVYFADADTGITVWADKAKFSFWRPITAIRQAAGDGNRRTVADPTWLPLIDTPPYPDQPSGLTSLAGASAGALQGFFGTDRRRVRHHEPDRHPQLHELLASGR